MENEPDEVMRFLVGHYPNAYSARDLAKEKLRRGSETLAVSTIQTRLKAHFDDDFVVKTSKGKYRANLESDEVRVWLNVKAPTLPDVHQSAARASFVDLDVIRQSLVRVNYNLCRILNARLDERAIRGRGYVSSPAGFVNTRSRRLHPLAELWGIAEESLVVVRRVEESYGFLKRKRGSFLSLRRTKYYGYGSLSGVSWEGHVQDIPLYLRKIEEALGDLKEQNVAGLKGFSRNMGKRVEDMQTIYKADAGTDPTL